MSQLVYRTLTLCLVALLCPLARAQAVPEASKFADQPAAIVPMTGQIDDSTTEQLIRRFDKAKSLGAKVIVVAIDSPGGQVPASMDISRFLKRQTDVHTIAWVKDKAYSGASMVAVACNAIYMAPGSVIGDCAPIIFDNSGGLASMAATERAKQESPIVDEFIDSAHRNGYSPVLLTAMVTLRKPVFVIQNEQGKLRVVDKAEYKELTSGEDAEWKLADGFENVNRPHDLVTLRAKQAEELGLSKGQADSPQSLLSGLRDPVVADLSPTTGDQIISFFNNPFVRMILLTIFLQSLYITLTAPGHGAAEATALVTLALLIGVPLLTGYAQWWEVAVIFGGLALCAFEILVFPGHFVSLILGSIMLVVGLVMTFVPLGLPGWVPSSSVVWHGVQNGLLVIVGALFGWMLLAIWLRRYLKTIPYFNRLILTATTGNVAAAPLPGDKPRQEAWPFIGTIGIAATDLRPGGSAQFPYADTTRNSQVVSSSGYIPQGAKVFVEEIQGSSVRVRAVE
jgi:membrane-bound serine protease (ClpP class)